MKSLKHKTSFGVDEFPPTLIKQCKEVLVEPLTYFKNQSFREVSFPNMLKIGINTYTKKKRK